MSLSVSQPIEGSVTWALLSGDRSLDNLSKEDTVNLLREAKMVYTVAEVALGLVALSFLSEFALVGALVTGLAAVIADDGRVVLGRIIEKLEDPERLSEFLRSAADSVSSSVSLLAHSVIQVSFKRGAQSHTLAEIRGMIQDTYILTYLEPYLNLEYLGPLLDNLSDQ